MPAASYSSSVSWGVYTAASFFLLLVCSSSLSGVRSAAYANAAAQTASGLAGVVDGLAPGMTVVFSYHSPLPSGRIELLGRNVTVVWGGATSTCQTQWPLTALTLGPDLHYRLELLSGRVVVTQIV